MTVATIYAGTNDARIATGPQAVYADARSGVGAAVNAGTATTEQAGQEKYTTNYYCYEYALDFDTSGIPAGATITAAVLSLRAFGGNSGSEIQQARLTTFAGSNPAAADFIPGASLSSHTLLAHTGAASTLSTSVFTDFTDDAMAANIVKGGHTQIIVTSDRMAAGTTATTAEYVSWYTANNSGTANDPKLVVTYTVSEDHTGTVALTGAGSVTLVAAKGALAAVTLTGAGSVTLAQATARASAVVLTGGGVLVLAPTSARFGTVVITGAGSVTVSGGIAMGVIAGFTRDADGNPIGFCTVDAFDSATNILYGTTTSNAAGRYAIVVVPGVAYFLVAYSATDVYGVTARDIVGV